MPRFMVQDNCFGFRNRRWKEGQEVDVEEAEVVLLPRDKQGNIIHFVLPDDYVPHDPLTGGRPVIGPDGKMQKLDRTTRIAMPPDSERATGGIAVKVGRRSARETAGTVVPPVSDNPDVGPGGMPPAAVEAPPSRRGKGRGGRK